MSVKYDKPYPGDWYPKGPGPGKETLPDAENVSMATLRGERGSNQPMNGNRAGMRKGAVDRRPGTVDVSRTTLLGERGGNAAHPGNRKKSY